MKIAFFLQNNHVQRNSSVVALYAHAHGYEVIDRSSTSELDVDDIGINWTDYDAVIPYGSVQFIRKVRNSGLAHHVDYDECSFSTDFWNKKFGAVALNGDGLTFRASQIEAYLSSGLRVHIRPNSVDKAFVAKVFDSKSWAEMRNDRKIQDSLIVYAASEKTIMAEYRFWVIDGQIVEGSRYMLDGHFDAERVQDSDLIRRAQMFAHHYTPSREVVMDLALTDQGLRLIEFNPIYGAGFYASDANVIWDAVVNRRKQLHN